MSEPAAAPPRPSGEDFYRSFLVGYGALFFAARPVSGALFLLGTFAASPVVGTAVLVGILAATATAHILRRSRYELESGLYGFNGALSAFALFSLHGDHGTLYLCSAFAAALTVPLTIRMVDGAWVQRLSLPVLSLPSLLVGFPLLWVLVRYGDAAAQTATMFPAYLSRGSLFDAGLYEAGMLDAISSASRGWPTLLFFLLGYALHSRRLLLHLAGGLLLGAATGYAFLGWVGALDFSFVVITALPVFVALSAVFTGSGWRAVLFGALGVVLSFFAWFEFGLFLADSELPLLTAPFFCTTALLLLALRCVPPESWRWLPRLVPLHQVGAPTDASRWAEGRSFGWRYWQELAGRLEGSWQDYTTEEQLARARDLVRRSRRIVFLTGAGISTESGIPDYRTGAVAWKQYETHHFRWENFMASEESRRRYWEMSQDFYLVLRTARPNAGHTAIAGLERLGKLQAIVTQNVDRLHQRAGASAERTIEIHGNEHRVTCLNCGHAYERDEIYRWILNGVDVPYCSLCQGILKPDSVAFGQPMIEAESRRAFEAVEACDLLVVAGTSLEVQPVASLPLRALRAGKPLIVVNLQPTDYDPFADHVFRGSCGALLPELCRID